MTMRIPSSSSFSVVLSCPFLHTLIQTSRPIGFLHCSNSSTNQRSFTSNVRKSLPSLSPIVRSGSAIRRTPYFSYWHIPTRGYSGKVSDKEFLVQKLSHRQVLRISGPEGAAFLQGLVTNDVEILSNTDDNHASSFYTMMLNAQGRVLYDLIIYQLKSDTQTILVECNADISADLLKLLARYKLRKKLSLSNCADEINVWTAFPRSHATKLTNKPQVSSLSLNNNPKLIACVPDPRLPSFAYRILCSPGVDASTIVENSETVVDGYDKRRYEFGLSEGTKDLPPGDCLPLDSNLAFLNGVSFSKGCYIGQELTARTQYTGVIRKRIMPLVFSSDIEKEKTIDATVETQDGKPCGKVRSVAGRRGLGLLRVQEVLTKGPLRIKSGKEMISEAETFVPDWWQTDSDEILKMTMSKKTESG